MSPRFDRRPNPRMSSGGRGAAGRPSRFSSPKPEWKRSGDGGSREGGAREGGAREATSNDGAFRRVNRDVGRGDSRDGRSDSRGAGRADRRGSSREERSFTDRSARGDRPSFDRSSSERPRFDRPAGERRSVGGYAGKPYAGKPAVGRFGAGRTDAGRSDAGRSDAARTSGERRFQGPRDSRDRFGGRDRFSARSRIDDRPLIVDAEAQGAAGESERHGIEEAPDLLWGRHPALAALESGRPIHRIWCTPEMRFSPKFLQLLRESKSSGVLVEEVTWARLGQLTGGAVHQGIALQVAAAETLDLATLIEGCAVLGEPALLMAVDGLTDPHNLGAIVRSAEALGAHGLVLPQRRCAGLTGSVAKVAAGALEHLPVARVVNLNRALDSLKREGYRVVGLAEEGTVSLEEADLDGPLVIVTGSESDGLAMLTRRNCDQLVRIPLRGATPSLNASVATALLLYEVARRGWMKGLRGTQPAPRIVRPQLPTSALQAAEGPTAPEGAVAAGQDCEPAELGLPPLLGQADAAAMPLAEVFLAGEVRAEVVLSEVNISEAAPPATFNGDVQL